MLRYSGVGEGSKHFVHVPVYMDSEIRNYTCNMAGLFICLLLAPATDTMWDTIAHQFGLALSVSCWLWFLGQAFCETEHRAARLIEKYHQTAIVSLWRVE